MNLHGLMNDTDEDSVKKIIYLMERDESADAPEAAVQWAKNVFRARAAEPKKSFVEQILAVLQMDLSPNKAAFGERSATGLEARQMLFGAGENGIDLRVSPGGKGFSVRGQILGAGFAEAAVSLVGSDHSYAAQTNELSEFVFADVPEGNYQIILKSADKEIAITNLEIG